MGGSDSARSTDPPQADLFPWLVTLGCLGVALLLFGHSTMPALAERDALRAVQEQKEQELDSAAAAAEQLRRRNENVGNSPEILMRELDSRGLLPPEREQDESSPR